MAATNNKLVHSDNFHLFSDDFIIWRVMVPAARMPFHCVSIVAFAILVAVPECDGRNYYLMKIPNWIRRDLIHHQLECGMFLSRFFSMNFDTN